MDSQEAAAAAKFVEAVANSGRKMTRKQTVHICKTLADFYPASNDAITKNFDMNLLSGIPQAQIDGKLQNERARLRKILGEGKNAEGACQLAEIRQAWKSYSDDLPAGTALSTPKTDSSEYSLFMEKVKKHGGEERAEKLDDAFKAGGHVLKPPCSDEPATQPPVALESFSLTIDPDIMYTQVLSSLPTQSQSAEPSSAAQPKVCVSRAEFELFTKFMAFKNSPQAVSAPTTPSVSAPASPSKSDFATEGSRDSSPVPVRPAKVAKIGEQDSDTYIDLSPTYDPPSIEPFDLKWYGGVIEGLAHGHVLLVDRSAREVVITLGCPWWAQMVVNVDSNDLKPAISVNVVPDDAGLFAILTKVDSDLITEASWKVKVTKSNWTVPQRPLHFNLPIPKRVIDKREISIQPLPIEETFRIIRVHMPIKQ